MAEFDVLIVGGGITGLTLACALAQRTSLSIAVLESKIAKPWSSASYAPRVSAITLASKKIFQTLKVWDSVQQKRVSPFREIAVWDAADDTKLSFNAREIAEPYLGYIIENDLLQTALLERVRQLPSIQYIAPVKLEKFSGSAKGIEIETYKTRLAVAADGAHSWLRAQANIEVNKQDYAQAAIVCAVETEIPHEQTARQIFLPDGPLAFLPLQPPNLTSIVWSLPTEKAQQFAALDETEFKNNLEQAFAHLGQIKTVSQRFVFPLYRQQAKQYIAPHLALVGDAAHTVHPLAGQGVNIGLLDAVSLVDVITKALHSHRDYASFATLRRYERWRKADNLPLYQGIHVIKQVFAWQHPAAQNLRSFGLSAIDCMGWVKNIFTRHAVGNRVGIPPL